MARRAAIAKSSSVWNHLASADPTTAKSPNGTESQTTAILKLFPALIVHPSTVPSVSPPRMFVSLFMLSLNDSGRLRRRASPRSPPKCHRNKSRIGSPRRRSDCRKRGRRHRRVRGALGRRGRHSSLLVDLGSAVSIRRTRHTPDPEVGWRRKGADHRGFGYRKPLDGVGLNGRLNSSSVVDRTGRRPCFR